MTSPFILIDNDANTLLKFSSKTAREAALKAATRNNENIIIVDTTRGKLHIFEGWRKTLDAETLNNYEKNRGITKKPIVRKMCYANFNRKLNMNNSTDKSEILHFLSTHQ